MTDLDKLLKKNKVDCLVIVGIAAHFCVMATSIDAFHLGYKIIWADDCISASSPDKKL